MMKGKVIALLALLALCVAKCHSSAIPMWEYLSKDEKVSNRAEIKSFVLHQEMTERPKVVKSSLKLKFEFIFVARCTRKSKRDSLKC